MSDSGYDLLLIVYHSMKLHTLRSRPPSHFEVPAYLRILFFLCMISNLLINRVSTCIYVIQDQARVIMSVDKSVLMSRYG